MRVDFVITGLFVGGAERCLTELALGLAQRGDDVRVFSLASLPTGVQSLLVDRLKAANVPVESGDSNHFLRTPRAYSRLKSWLKESPADVCQTFMFHANVLGALAAKSAGIKVRVGGLRVAEPRPVRCRIEKFAVKRMNSLVCVSNEVKRFAQEYLACDCTKSLVIPNSVDVQRFKNSKVFDWQILGWPRDAVVSVFVGRLHPQKGIELLQSQIDSLAPANSNRKLLLVGGGPLRSDLQAWADGIGEQRVQLLPWQKDVAPIISASRLLVLPSHYEGMPNVVLEAMAAGKPVVCSRVEGSQELLSHAIDQQSFAPGDAEAMKKLAETFLSDEQFSGEIGAKNQTRAESDFSIDSMVDAYRDHYQSAVISY